MNHKDFMQKLTELCNTQRAACRDGEASLTDMAAALMSNLIGLHLLHGDELSTRTNDAIQALLTSLLVNMGDKNAEPNESDPEA